MLLALMFACGTIGGVEAVDALPPAAVPAMQAEALRVQAIDDVLVVSKGAQAMGQVPLEQLEDDPVDATAAALVSLLQGAPELWVDLPASMPWYRVRKVVGSARAAEVGAVWLGVEGSPDQPVRGGVDPTIGLKMSCRGGPLAWTGVQPRVTVALQQSAEGSWAVANARFLPVVDGIPTDGLPSECLAPMDCGMFSGDQQAACEEGRSTPFAGRVELGGSVGCLLPFLNRPNELALWTDELTPVLTGLELTAADPVLVSPEARVRWDVVVTMLRGFAAAGLPVPSLGQPLVEGNDGPPMCTADVRDGAALRAAGAKRAGTLMGPKGEEG